LDCGRAQWLREKYLYHSTDIEGFGRSVWIINPDDLSARIAQNENLPLPEANAEALNRIMTWLESSIRAYQTVGVETVLSTGKYRPLVERAKTHGFEIQLLYVTLRSVELNIERVRLRVAQGGHHVAENKIRERRLRSFEQLAWFLDKSDVASIYDNSGAKPALIARKSESLIEVDPDAPDEIKKAIGSIAE
jgi:predicted ABC-type ATPase